MEFGIYNLWLREWGYKFMGYGVEGAGFMVKSPKSQGSGFWAWGLGIRVQGLRLMVKGLGFRDLGLRVQDLGFRV